MQEQKGKKYQNMSPYSPQINNQRFNGITLDSDKQFSPWNSQQYKKVFVPRYFDTLNPRNKLQKKKMSLPLGISTSSNAKHTFGPNISQDFLNLVKLQKKGLYIHNQIKDSKEKTLRMNLVNVNLDYDVIYCPEKKYGMPVEMHQQDRKTIKQDNYRQQPTKVRILKLIKEKHNIGNDKKTEDINGLFKFSDVSQNQQQISFYPSMPKRLPKTKENTHKLSNLFDNDKLFMLPSLQRQRNFSEQIKQETIVYGKGSILQKGENQKLRKMRYRSYLTKDHFNPGRPQEKALFLCQTLQK